MRRAAGWIAAAPALAMAAGHVAANPVGLDDGDDRRIEQSGDDDGPTREARNASLPDEPPPRADSEEADADTASLPPSASRLDLMALAPLAIVALLAGLAGGWLAGWLVGRSHRRALTERLAGLEMRLRETRDQAARRPVVAEGPRATPYAPPPAPPPPPPSSPERPTTEPPRAAAPPSAAALGEIMAGYARLAGGTISRSEFQNFFNSLGPSGPVEIAENGAAVRSSSNHDGFLTSVAVGGRVLVFPSFEFIANRDTQFSTIAGVPEEVAALFDLARGSGDIVVERPATFDPGDVVARLVSRGSIAGFPG